ncbi:unnamed protein product [Linum trigynum]|uniref:Uncharacterized protein n=1 Tax=Linum trigynum TaxID=586398 RepID=A0AAV2D0E6_9ROSI
MVPFKSSNTSMKMLTSLNATFNVIDLAPFLEDDSDLRANHFRVEWNDNGINTKAFTSSTLVREGDVQSVQGQGPITRSRAKAFKSQLQDYLAKNFENMEA